MAVDRDASRKALAASPVFAVLLPAERDALAGSAAEKSFAAGAVLFHEGDATDAILVIARGSVRLSRTSAKGQVLVLRRCAPGEILGQMSSIDGGRHSVTAVAEEKTVVARISRDRFVAALEKSPASAMMLARMLAGRVRELSHELEAMKFQSIGSRVVARLRERAKGRAELKLTHAALAEEVGATRENVSRVLETLEEAGVVALGRGRITIRDHAALESFEP